MKRWLSVRPLPWWQRTNPVVFGMVAAAIVVIIYNIVRRL